MHIRPQIYLIPVPNIFDSSSRYRYVELCSTMHWCFKIHIASSPQPTDPQCNAFHNVLALHNAMHCNASQCNALQWTCRQKHRTNSATDNEKQQFWQKLQIFCSSSSTALSTQLSIVVLITFWAKFWLHFWQSFVYILSKILIIFPATFWFHIMQRENLLPFQSQTRCLIFSASFGPSDLYIWPVSV